MKRVKWASDDKICQVKKFTSEDRPSQISRKTKDRHQKTASMVETRTSGSRSKEHSSSSKQVRIPMIKWKCPPKIMLKSEWQVAAGEESKERIAQKYREARILEALYPRVSTIPSSPSVSPEAKSCDYDDSQTPIVPLTPIEEEIKDSMLVESMPCSESVECNVPPESKALSDVELHSTAAGFDADVHTAATFALTALLKANENGNMVDTDLLIKILKEPKMVEALLNMRTTEIVSSVDSNHEAHAKLKSAVDTSFNPQTIQADSEIFGSNLNLRVSDLGSSRPSSSVSSTLETQVSIGSFRSHRSVSTPAIKLDNASSQPSSSVSSTLETQVSIGSFRSHLSVSTPAIKLDNASSRPSSSVSSTLETQVSIGSFRSHPSVSTPAIKLDNASSRPSSSVSSTLETQVSFGSFLSHPSVSTPAIKLDNASNIPRNAVPTSSSAMFGSDLNPKIMDLKSFRPSPLFSSTKPNGQSLTRETLMFFHSLPSHSSVCTAASKAVVPISGTHFPPKFDPLIPDFISSQPTSMVSSTRVEVQSLTPKSQMLTNSFTSHSSVDVRVVKDANYYKNLVRLHGMVGNETHEHQPPECKVSAPEAKARKPCKFFNSSKGCRNGPTCPFDHASLPNPQAGKFLDAFRSKRFKISHEITG